MNFVRRRSVASIVLLEIGWVCEWVTNKVNEKISFIPYSCTPSPLGCDRCTDIWNRHIREWMFRHGWFAVLSLELLLLSYLQQTT